MAPAVLSAAPMPCPISRYQAPFAAAISMPACLPQRKLGRMRAGLVAARDERRALCLIVFSAVSMSLPPTPRRIALRPDQHEIVVHDVEALHAKAFGEELLLRRLGVHEHHVGVAAPRDIERLSGAVRDHLDLDAGLGLEASAADSRTARTARSMWSRRPRSIGPAQRGRKTWRRRRRESAERKRSKRLGMSRLLQTYSEHEIAAHEAPRPPASRGVEKICGVPCSHSAPRTRKDDVAREPAHLAEIVRGHHDLDAGLRGAFARSPRRRASRPDRDWRSARRATESRDRAPARAPAPAAAARRPKAAAPVAAPDRTARPAPATRRPARARSLRGMPACANA